MPEHPRLNQAIRVVRNFRFCIRLSFFIVWTLFSPGLFADEELNLDFANPSGPFLAVEHAGPQDHIYYNLLVTDEPTEKVRLRDDVQMRVVVTNQRFATRFAMLGESFTKKGLIGGQCGAQIAHLEHSYAVRGRIAGLNKQDFCFILNPRDSTRLLQGLLIESLKNLGAPPELEHVLDEMLRGMPSGIAAE